MAQSWKKEQYCAESLEPRALLAGLTLITHGFASGAGPGTWVDTMADAVAARLGEPSEVSQYLLRAHGTHSGGPTSLEFSRDPSSPPWSTNATGEAIIKVDW